MTATTPAQRRETQRAQTRRAILAATETLVLEGGVDQFTIRRLVAACGYTVIRVEICWKVFAPLFLDQSNRSP